MFLNISDKDNESNTIQASDDFLDVSFILFIRLFAVYMDSMCSLIWYIIT